MSVSIPGRVLCFRLVPQSIVWILVAKWKQLLEFCTCTTNAEILNLKSVKQNLFGLVSLLNFTHLYRGVHLDKGIGSWIQHQIRTSASSTIIYNPKYIVLVRGPLGEIYMAQAPWSRPYYCVNCCRKIIINTIELYREVFHCLAINLFL